MTAGNTIRGAGTISGAGSVSIGSGAPTFAHSLLVSNIPTQVLFQSSPGNQFYWTGSLPEILVNFFPVYTTTTVTVTGITSGPYITLNNTTFTCSSFDASTPILATDYASLFDDAVYNLSWFNSSDIQADAPGFTLNWD